MASASGLEKKYDVVVFGATGFTGQFVVEEIARTQKEEPGLTWAIAGRSMSKLQKVLLTASKFTGEPLEDTPILIADVSSESSLQDMCQQSRIILNCVGPYSMYGDPVVRACIENKAHHIDISGEPGFLEKVQLLYHDKAKEAGVYVLGSCGFDSIPSDLGVTFTKEKFEGDLNHIEMYLGLKFGPQGMRGNFGTWQSAVHGFSQMRNLKNIRKQLFPTRMPRSKHSPPKRRPIFYSDEVKGWCIPFVGSDKSVVQRTQRYNYEERKERPVQFSAYMRTPNLLMLCLFLMVGLVFGVLSSFSLGRYLLETFPRLFSLGIFSKTGPSRKQIEDSSFIMTMVGHGFEKKISDPDQQHEDIPSKKIITRVSGPEIGYVTTPICMLQAAYVLLKEQEKIPKGGGVFTPAGALQDTSLIDRLNKHKVRYEVRQQ